MIQEGMMARIIYRHPSRTGGAYHVYTDLDFWDARCILGDIAVVKRNFEDAPPGDEYPTRVVAKRATLSTTVEIEKRLKKAIASPPRHVIVRAMFADGSFEFDPAKYYPARWSQARMLHFTYHRLPLQQPALTTTYQTVQIGWVNDKIRVERIRRKEKYDPAILDRKAAKRRLRVPSCF
jgi:hypothetical protein